MIRLIILLVTLGVLTLLALQNLSPVLPIVFLGAKTVSLPLAVWILSAIAAGFITYLLMAGLFRLSNYLAVQEIGQDGNFTSEKSRFRRQPKTQVRNTAREAEEEDDFEDDFLEETTENTYNYEDYPRNNSDYERQSEPKTKSQSGSVYSYGYRDNNDSGVGKTESIYDADYRVIKPPFRKIEDNVKPDDWTRKEKMDNNTADDDDWGFFDDIDNDEDDVPKKDN